MPNKKDLPNKADAMPTKAFFVNMITRDISLEDCILDLIDNCLDGARRCLTAGRNAGATIESYTGFRAALSVHGTRFCLEDNCGGISLDNAISYAFHFGRRPDAPVEESAIGLYGIGMKRALLKIGRSIRIHSSTDQDKFLCTIDVPEWLKDPEWLFDLDDAASLSSPGTAISITDLNAGIDAEFADTSFVNGLSRMIERDYARFLQKGFEITVNGTRLGSYGYTVKEAADFKAYRHSYEDGEVAVEVIAGMAAPPPRDIGPSERGDTENYGWFVFCNDRVVLAGDRTERTVWGDEKFPRWHFQYNGFMGLVLFHAKDPTLLPWTTTKRDVDESSPLYRRAVAQMKKVTRPWIEYTNQRKTDLDNARKRERAATTVPAFEVSRSPVLRVPQPPEKPKVRMANILYKRPVTEVNRIRRALRRSNMSYKAVGERTFDYFVEHEIED